MAIWTEKDIKKSGIRIRPKPVIRDISIDLSLEKLFSIENPDAVHEIMGPLDPLDPAGGKSVGFLDLLKLTERKPAYGRWYLNKLVPVVAKYREKIGRPRGGPKLQMDITQRSTYARCGIGGFSCDLKDGQWWELLIPVVDNIIYPGDKISQLTIMDEDTTVVGRNKVHELIERNEVAIFPDINPGMLFARVMDEGCVLLTLNRTAYYFNGKRIDKKSLKKDDFTAVDLMKNRVRKYNFLIGRSNETVSTSSRYAGKLTKADPVHLSTITYAPYIKPDTCGYVVTEMFHTKDSGIHPDLAIPMYLVEVKTPCEYGGKFHRQRDVVFPFCS